MALVHNVNVVTTNGNYIPFALKELLVSLTTPWEVRGSGDGDSLVEDVDQATGGAGGGNGGAYDVWTSTQTYEDRIPGSNAYPKAWVRLREPGSTREWVIRRSYATGGSRDDQWQIKFSPTGFTTGPVDSQKPPTASDEIYLTGDDSTDYREICTPTGYQYRVHIIAEDTPINGVYPWRVLVTTMSQNAHIIWLYDALDEPVPGDQQPFVWHLDRGSPATTFAMSNDSTSTSNFVHPAAFRGYGEVDERFSGCPGLLYWSKSDTFLFPDHAGNSSIDGKERAVPILFGSPDNGFYKGFGHSIRWPGESRNYPNTAQLATPDDAWVYFDSALIRWPTGETPL